MRAVVRLSLRRTSPRSHTRSLYLTTTLDIIPFHARSRSSSEKQSISRFSASFLGPGRTGVIQSIEKVA